MSDTNGTNNGNGPGSGGPTVRVVEGASGAASAPSAEPRNSLALSSLQADIEAQAQLGDGTINAFSGGYAFETAQRMALALSKSTIVPKEYQGNPSNCLIAIEISSRIRTSVLMVMQNLDVIHGRPGWRATFLIGAVNASRRFSPMRFRFEGTRGTDTWACRAVAKDLQTGEELVGTLITMAMVKAEGWYDRNGSKWKTMAEQMFQYRAAAFWARVYAPEISLGMGTSDEVEDTAGSGFAPREGAIEVRPESVSPPAQPPKQEGTRVSLKTAPAQAPGAPTTVKASAPPAAETPPAEPRTTTVVKDVKAAVAAAAKLSSVPAGAKPATAKPKDAGDVISAGPGPEAPAAERELSYEEMEAANRKAAEPTDDDNLPPWAGGGGK